MFLEENRFYGNALTLIGDFVTPSVTWSYSEGCFQFSEGSKKPFFS